MPRHNIPAVQDKELVGESLFAGSWTRVSKWAARVTVLAVLALGTIGYVSLNKTVVVDVDGHLTEANFMGLSVKDALRSVDVTLEQGDLVVPALKTRVANGDYVSVRTQKQLDVEIDGELETLTTTAVTVGDVLAELGTRGQSAETSASRGSVLGRDLLKIKTAKTITVEIDGGSLEHTTYLPTVRDALLDLDVILEEGDSTSAELDETLVDGQQIVVSRAGTDRDTVTETLAFETVEKEDPYLVKGEKVVLQKGRTGKSVTTYDITTMDGKESERVVLARSILVEPKDEILGIGTLDISDPANKILSPSEARALGKSMVLNRGWEETEFKCLDKLWTKESNWRVQAENSSSGAYGIPQSYPGTKMATVGADWRTNAKTQITWGLNYVAGRYGTPCSAWGHSQNTGWY